MAGEGFWNTAGTLDAADISITDAGGYFAGTDVEAALQELGGVVPTGLTGLVVVEAGSQASAAYVGVISIIWRWGIDTGGVPYFNSTGVVKGEEAILAFDPDTGVHYLVPATV